MEKLRRVLAGQDDEEQGLTAQVRPGIETPLSLTLPSSRCRARAGSVSGAAACPAPACAHPPRSPGCPAVPEPGTHRQAKERPKFAACAEGRGLWAAGSALSFGELLLCGAFGRVVGLGSCGFRKVFLCLSGEFGPDNLLCSLPT